MRSDLTSSPLTISPAWSSPPPLVSICNPTERECHPQARLRKTVICHKEVEKGVTDTQREMKVRLEVGDHYSSLGKICLSLFLLQFRYIILEFRAICAHFSCRCLYCFSSFPRMCLAACISLMLSLTHRVHTCLRDGAHKCGYWLLDLDQDSDLSHLTATPRRHRCCLFLLIHAVSSPSAGRKRPDECLLALACVCMHQGPRLIL